MRDNLISIKAISTLVGKQSYEHTYNMMKIKVLYMMTCVVLNAFFKWYKAVQRDLVLQMKR
jgi:hypothetical protein